MKKTSCSDMQLIEANFSEIYIYINIYNVYLYKCNVSNNLTHMPFGWV